jgi:hypothetical protein
LESVVVRRFDGRNLEIPGLSTYRSLHPALRNP